jgi:NTE family protein
MRIAVTATNVQTGDQVCFSNYVANPDAIHYVTPKIKLVNLTPDHILASGSLPPGFPMTVIDGVPYWDGGLFDNTPIETLLDLLENDEIDHLPIFVVNLFATHATVPANLREVQERMLEISFESRFLLAHADADGSLSEFTETIEEIMRDLPQDSPVRGRESFRRIVRFRALKNIRIIEADHAPMTGGMDFSAHGVRSRYESGYKAVDKLFKNGELAADTRRETRLPSGSSKGANIKGELLRRLFRAARAAQGARARRTYTVRSRATALPCGMCASARDRASASGQRSARRNSTLNIKPR